jgi:hypothetical protein
VGEGVLQRGERTGSVLPMSFPIPGAFARQEPMRLDRGQQEESEQDGGGHDDPASSLIKVSCGRSRAFTRAGMPSSP